MKVQAKMTEPVDSVEVAPDLHLPSPTTVEAQNCNGFDVELVVVASPMRGGRPGRVECQELRVKQRRGGPEVTLAGIRSVPVATITRLGLSRIVRVGQQGPTVLAPKQLAAGGPTNEALKAAAAIYRVAAVLGEPPRKAVREAMGLPTSTAGRWVAMARERGFLGPAEGPGKVGKPT